MTQPAAEFSDKPARPLSKTESTEPSSQLPPLPEDHGRNFWLMAAYHVIMRCGWIFKTESIIMPLVLDLMGGTAWIRSFLPLLNRLGQSVPPLLIARRVKIMPRKKWALATSAAMMAVCFFSLSGIWKIWFESMPWWLPLAFLFFYAAFFASTGINQLSFGTLQGKLVAVTFRGRLMVVANVCGAAAAILCVWLLMPIWLSDQAHQFEWIFAFSGICFGLSSLCSLLLSEESDCYKQPRVAVHRIFIDAWSILRNDKNFRRLAIIAALFNSSIMLFPHYQALGRGTRMGIGLSEIVTWVIIQNAGTALFSIVTGPIADWRGNRLVLRIVLLMLCAAPITAIALSHMQHIGSLCFPIVFLLVGLTPVIYKVFANYTLEVAKPADHPRYLSTINLCMAAPIFLSPLVGSLIDPLGYDIVFLAVTSVIAIGWLLTFRLHEPRNS